MSVDIGDNFFSPRELTITVGTTVRWTNKGQRPHTSTAEDGSWDSGDEPDEHILPGQSFSHTFATSGEFPTTAASTAGAADPGNPVSSP